MEDVRLADVVFLMALGEAGRAGLSGAEFRLKRGKNGWDIHVGTKLENFGSSLLDKPAIKREVDEDIQSRSVQLVRELLEDYGLMAKEKEES